MQAQSTLGHTLIVPTVEINSVFLFTFPFSPNLSTSLLILPPNCCIRSGVYCLRGFEVLVSVHIVTFTLLAIFQVHLHFFFSFHLFTIQPHPTTIIYQCKLLLLLLTHPNIIYIINIIVYSILEESIRKLFSFFFLFY